MKGSTSSWRRETRRPGAAAALPAVAVLVLFADVLVGRSAFFHIDLFHEHVPVWGVVGAALRAGRSPWWLPGSHAGQPLLYTQEAPLFYPLTVPFLLTGAPAHLLVSLFTLLHLALAGVLAFVFVRERTGDRDAALLGGFAYALGTRTVLSALWPNAAGVAALLPLLLLALARMRDGAPRSVPLGGIALGLALLLSRPQSLLGAAPLLIAVALWGAASAPDPRRATARLAGAAALGLAIGAPALLPVLAIHGEMARGTALSAEERGVATLGAPGNGLAKLVLPERGLDATPEAASYPGIVPAALFAWGLARAARRRDALPLVLAAGGAVGLAFAFGDAGPYRLLSSLPLLASLRAPARFLGSLSAAVALGAGLAAAELGNPRLKRLLALLTLGDLAIAARGAAPLVPAAVYTQPSPLAGHLRALPRDASGFPPRVWSFAPILFDERLASPEGPALTARADGLALDRLMALGIDGVTGGAPPTARIRELTLRADERALALFGVSRAILVRPDPVLAADPVSSGSFFVGAPADALPRATVAGTVVTVPPALALEATGSARFVPGAMAIVEGGAPRIEGAARPQGRARLLSREPDAVELEASAPEGGLLVLRESWASGWSVRVDGTLRPLLRADGAFRGVLLEAGTHRVSFRYRPPALRFALALAAAGAVLALLLAAAPRVPRRA